MMPENYWLHLLLLSLAALQAFTAWCRNARPILQGVSRMQGEPISWADEKGTALARHKRLSDGIVASQNWALVPWDPVMRGLTVRSRSQPCVLALVELD